MSDGGQARGYFRRAFVSLPLKHVACIKQHERRSIMRNLVTLAIVAVALGLGLAPARAASPEEKGKTCRTEQQCHWENFKKICVYVKVCR